MVFLFVIYGFSSVFLAVNLAILKEGHYKGAYLLGYDEIVNLLNTEFECINEKSLTDTGYLFVRKDKEC